MICSFKIVFARVSNGGDEQSQFLLLHEKNYLPSITVPGPKCTIKLSRNPYVHMIVLFMTFEKERLQPGAHQQVADQKNADSAPIPPARPLRNDLTQLGFPSSFHLITSHRSTLTN